MDKLRIEAWRINVMQGWLDKNGLVKTRRGNTDSGNGVLYTSMFFVRMARMLNGDIPGYLEGKLRDVYKRCSCQGGILKRTPDNSYGVESHDDVWGILSACAVYGLTDIPRRILRAYFMHLFLSTNRFPARWKEVGDMFFIRMPHLIAFMWVTSFPGLRTILWPVFWAFAKLTRLPANPKVDASGAELTDTILSGLDAIYGTQNEFRKIITKASGREWFDDYVADAITVYYDGDHPYLKMPDGYSRY